MPYDTDYELDSLAELARQAGYFPEEKIEPPPSEYAYTPPDSSPYETRQDPNAFSASMGYTPPPATPVLPEPKPVAPGTSHSGSYATSESSRGFSPTKFGQVRATSDQALEQGFDQAEATAEASGQRALPLVNAAYESKVDAERAMAEANVNAIRQRGEDALVMQRLQDEFAAEENKINAESTAMSNQAKMDYMAALADFRAAKVDPAQLWNNMTGGERFGTLASAFVHDFLGAKGINTSAMATLNKAIDRNIDAQVQAIRTKGEVAEGFKSLWYMQRNQSASDAEARARVRTFLLDGAKQAVIANMAPYESALASAQGKAAIAKIDEELAKSYIDVYRHIDANSVALRAQALSKWQTQVNAALESQANSIRRQEANTHARAVDKQNKPAMPVALYDPESKKPVAFYKPHVTSKQIEATEEALANAASVNKDLIELRRLARNLGDGTIDPITGTRLAGTTQQQYDATAVRLAHGMVKALGERATDRDVEQLIKGLRTPSFLNAANAEKVIAHTQDLVLNPVRATAAQLTYVPRADDAGNMIIENSPDDIIFPGSTAEAKGTYDPPKETTNEIHLKKASQGIGNKASKQDLPADEQTGDLRAAHEEMVRQRPDLFVNKEKRRKISPFGTIQDDGEVSTPATPKRFEKSLVELKRLAEMGGPEGANALARLQSVAAGYVLNHDDAEAAMAAYLLSTVKTDAQ